METFNIQRFGNVCTRLVMLRKKEYFNLFLAVVLFVGLFCVFTCNPLSGDAIEPLQYKYLFLQLGITIYSFSLILITIYGANIIRDLKTKQQRIDELVLPATNLEKFTARVLASTVLVLILVAAGIVAGDILQMLINMLLHKGTFASFCLSSFNVAFTELQTSILAIENVLHKPIRFMFLLTLISGNAFYLLGGMLFRKNSLAENNSGCNSYLNCAFQYVCWLRLRCLWLHKLCGLHARMDARLLVQHNTADSTDMRLLLFCL